MSDIVTVQVSLKSTNFLWLLRQCGTGRGQGRGTRSRCCTDDPRRFGFDWAGNLRALEEAVFARERP